MVSHYYTDSNIRDGVEAVPYKKTEYQTHLTNKYHLLNSQVLLTPMNENATSGKQIRLTSLSSCAG